MFLLLMLVSGVVMLSKCPLYVYYLGMRMNSFWFMNLENQTVPVKYPSLTVTGEVQCFGKAGMCFWHIPQTWLNYKVRRISSDI